MNHAKEIENKTRFKFGKNWASFLANVNETHIEGARQSFEEMIQMQSLAGKTFLDIGSGSGMSSLVAHQMGAKVYSFDYDPLSVACTKEIKRRFANNDEYWDINEGSVLDNNFMVGLGKFDIVYSWGVLHHTGAMWQAINAALNAVEQNGLLFIAVYNDQGWKSKIWFAVKELFNFSFITRILVIAVFFPLFFLGGFAADIIRLTNPFKRYSGYHKRRGMSVIHDWLDWLGGLPFEFATAEALDRYILQKGFKVRNQNTTNRLGCHELVYEKVN